MSYLKYISERKNLLIIWFSFHFLALFVNIFMIQGVFSEYFNLLCRYPDYKDNAASHFYPFVKIIEISDISGRKTYFNGIFYLYDISEFIAYSFLIFLILYIAYQGKNKKNI